MEIVIAVLCNIVVLFDSKEASSWKLAMSNPWEAHSGANLQQHLSHPSDTEANVGNGSLGTRLPHGRDSSSLSRVHVCCSFSHAHVSINDPEMP